MSESLGCAAAPEPRSAFAGFIGPRTLAGLVRNTAPWLWDDVELAPATEYFAIVRAGESLPARERPTPSERTEYFALCLAAHFATVATWVPTDVDTKVRHALWHDARGSDELPRMRALALRAAAWDPEPVSARVVRVAGAGAVSGHDGERLSVWCGGLRAARAAHDAAGAAELEAAIEAELWREARAFERTAAERGRELDALRLAAILTHNAGDVMQGLGGAAAPAFADLARAGLGRYGGAFARAAALYRDSLARDGHRHYPLRRARALRAHRELLLPIAPFLDGWGEAVARFPGFGDAERAEVIAALVDGCRKLPGQTAYFRALAGLERALPRGLDAPELAQHLPVSARRGLREAELRRRVAVSRESFEASAAKRARALLSA
ncbi:MAG TPA: hypothetical protein VMR86_15990 [Myxococcota bacterium]|nr:hypothetical protein [Myxococcota bacterium]